MRGAGDIFAQLGDVVDGFTPRLEDSAASAVNSVRARIQKGIAGEAPESSAFTSDQFVHTSDLPTYERGFGVSGRKCRIGDRRKSVQF